MRIEKDGGEPMLLNPKFAIRNPRWFGSLTIRHVRFCTHDVAVACCLAMAEVRVQLPLGAFFVFLW
jgi:hypothetical protein